ILDVYSETVAAHRVPRCVARVWREHGDACFFVSRTEIPEHLVGALCRAVQHDEQRKRRLAGVLWYLKHCVALSIEAKLDLSSGGSLDVTTRARRESSIAHDHRAA